MAKILLVEDDNNLREIYEARLQAEGYTIVSAIDGEKALVIAKNEKPDLVISDVMMPRISGFEMLDILRNTDGLKDVKVIMLTALGQAEDKTRADALGADRYLVKSQVTLEDIVKATHELLDGSTTAPVQTDVPAASVTPPPAAKAAEVVPLPTPTAATPPVVPEVPTPADPLTPTADVTNTNPVVTPSIPATEPETATPVPSLSAPAGLPEATPPPVTSVPTAPEPVSVAEPVSHPITPVSVPDDTKSASTEEAIIKGQIENFVNQSSQTTGAPSPTPETTTPVAPVEQPQASEDEVMAEAVEDLVADANHEKSNTPPPVTVTKASDVTTMPAPDVVSPSEESIPEPTTTQTPPTNPSEDEDEDENGVTVAHKKVIKPISSPESASNKSNLDDLLAKEGVDLGQETTSSTIGTNNPPVNNLPVTPHPPGHVIAPTEGVPPRVIDPNSISL
jgi:CheY-like chemotaxis protein